MSARNVTEELGRIERAALAQLVDNIQRADALLARIERDFPIAADRVSRARMALYRLPPGVPVEAGSLIPLRTTDVAADELARAWGEADDDDIEGAT